MTPDEIAKARAACVGYFCRRPDEDRQWTISVPGEHYGERIARLCLGCARWSALAVQDNLGLSGVMAVKP